jgi:hypothetical protein
MTTGSVGGIEIGVVSTLITGRDSGGSVPVVVGAGAVVVVVVAPRSLTAEDAGVTGDTAVSDVPISGPDRVMLPSTAAAWYVGFVVGGAALAGVVRSGAVIVATEVARPAVSRV